LDFAGGIKDGLIKDLSNFGHHAQVMGSPEFPEGGSPITDYVPPDYTAPSYMTVDGSSYLKIAHTDALALGKDNADFTVSFALHQTQAQGDWRNLLHKGNTNGERTPAI